MIAHRRPTRRVRRSAPGFTLIELLVTISIIGLLVSILLPALSGARRAARGLLCQTHLRGIGEAMHLYAHEFEGAFPLGEETGIHFSASVLPGLGAGDMGEVGARYRDGHVEAYLQLLGQQSGLQCPSFPNPRQRLDYVVNAFPLPYPRLDDPGRLGLGPRIENIIRGVDNTLFGRLNRLPRSASALLYITEGHQNLPTTTVSLHDAFHATQLPLAAWPRIANDRRHPAGVNAVFLDAHVEAFSPEALDVGWPRPLAERIRRFSFLR